MERALTEPWRRPFELAWEAFRVGSFPVGAVLCDPDGEPVAEAQEQRGEIAGHDAATARQRLERRDAGGLEEEVRVEEDARVQVLPGKLLLRDVPREAAARELFELDAGAPSGVFIPVGVAHGYYTLTDSTLAYLVDVYFDGSDELGVAWNDPDIAMPWDVRDPVLSARDMGNRRLSELSPGNLPKF